MWGCLDNQDVGLEAATIERVRNSSLVGVTPAMYRVKHITETVDEPL